MHRRKQSTRSTKQSSHTQPSRHSPSLPRPIPPLNPPHPRRSVSTSHCKDQRRTPTATANSRKPTPPAFHYTFQPLPTATKPSRRPPPNDDFNSTPIFPHFSTSSPTFHLRPSFTMQARHLTCHALKTPYYHPHITQTSHFSSLFNSPSQPSLLSQIVHPPGMDPKFVDMVRAPTPTPAQQQNMNHIDPELKEKLQTLLSPETKAHFDAPLGQKKLTPTADNIIHPETDEEKLKKEKANAPIMDGMPILHPHEVPVQKGPDLTKFGDVEIAHPDLPEEIEEEGPSPRVQTQTQTQLIPKVAKVRVRVGVKERSLERGVVVATPSVPV